MLVLHPGAQSLQSRAPLSSLAALPLLCHLHVVEKQNTKMYTLTFYLSALYYLFDQVGGGAGVGAGYLI